MKMPKKKKTINTVGLNVLHDILSRSNGYLFCCEGVYIIIIFIMIIYVGYRYSPCHKTGSNYNVLLKMFINSTL